MVKGTKAKKEEAEFRKIAKESREARKKVKLQIKKKERSELRRQAREGGAAGENKLESDGNNKTKRRTAAIILPNEISELRERLNLSSDQSSSNSTKNAKGKNKKNNNKAESSGRVSSGEVGGDMSSSSGSSSSSHQGSMVEEPKFHLELHYKKKMIIWDVILHHVPHQKINVSEMTASKLVVDTTGHTKKYRAEIPLPNGLRMDVEKGSYDLDHGVLKCRIPLLNEEVPVALQQEWEATQQKIREQRALRFKVSQDGELKVRMRQALLPPDLKAQQQVQKANEENVEENAEENAEDNGEVSPSKQQKKATTTTTTTSKKALPVEAKKDSAATPKQRAAKKDAFLEDQQRAKAIAKEAAKTIRATIAEKVQATREVHQRRLEKIQMRDDRRAVKDERRQTEFERILAEQKQKVVAEMAMQAEAEADRKERVAKKQSPGSGKTVTFD